MEKTRFGKIFFEKSLKQIFGEKNFKSFFQLQVTIPSANPVQISSHSDCGFHKVLGTNEDCFNGKFLRNRQSHF